MTFFLMLHGTNSISVQKKKAQSKLYFILEGRNYELQIQNSWPINLLGSFAPSSYFNIAYPKKDQRSFQTFHTGRCIPLVILEGANVFRFPRPPCGNCLVCIFTLKGRDHEASWGTGGKLCSLSFPCRL